MTVSVIQNCCHTDPFGRQFEFNLNSDGSIFVRIFHRLRDINDLDQKNIFVKFYETRCQQLQTTCIENRKLEAKKIIFNTVKKKECKILLKNGELTNVRKRVRKEDTTKMRERYTDPPVYFYKVSKITLELK